MCSQRLQDLNTRIRGRTRLILGNVSIDDYELKIHRLLRNSKYKTEILNFEQGKFFYVARDSIIKFPKYSTLEKPYEFKPSKIPETIQEKPTMKVNIKKPTIKQRLNYWWERFVSFPIPPASKKPTTQTVYAEDEEAEESDTYLVAEDEEEESESLFW